MVKHIRWQAFLSLVGAILMIALLNRLSSQVRTIHVPEPGGTYVEAIPAIPGNLNPLYASRRQNQANRDLADLIFSGLTRADLQGVLHPELAQAWRVSDDGTEYTFRLRRDVIWHDGAPFTAEDVAFTLGIVQDPEFSGDPALAEVWRGVEVVLDSPYTIRFVLPQALAPFAPFLSFTTFSVLPKHLLEEVPVADLPYAAFNRRPVGTGPWRVARFEPDHVLLEPHPAGPLPAPMLDHLVLRFYENVPTTLEALRDGEVMGVARVRPQDLPELLDDTSIELYTAPIQGYSAIFFNVKRFDLRAQNVREALMLGLDRQAMIDDVLNGQGIVAHGFLMPSHWAYNPNLPHYPHDLEDANALLDAAGWRDTDGDGIRDKDDQPLKFTLITDESDPQLTALAEEAARQWSRLGIEVEPLALPAAELAGALQDRNFGAALLATSPGGLPVDPDFYPLWHSSQASRGGMNYTSFVNPAADRLLVEARHQLDQETRRALYHEFQMVLARELPALPLYYPVYNYAVNSLIKDVQVGPLTRSADRFATYPSWYIRIKRLLVEADQPATTTTAQYQSDWPDE
jgi:peptide/nickel transport system substrate-binding protein